MGAVFAARFCRESPLTDRSNPTLMVGYGEGTYDLRHISRRPEFLGFFAQERGECWIVTNPIAESS